MPRNLARDVLTGRADLTREAETHPLGYLGRMYGSDLDVPDRGWHQPDDPDSEHGTFETQWKAA